MKTILILDDNDERRAAFRRTAEALGEDFELKVWRDATSMIAECEAFFPTAALISLDHDLNPTPGHAHPDGQTGAMAAALAAAWAVCESRRSQGQALIEFVLEHLPQTDTYYRLKKALEVPLDASPRTAARVLGNGSQVVSSDTIPFCLWCAARHIMNYPEALWATVSALGDRDTTCAIVATSDKTRFAFSDDGLRIRASQGHSVEVDLEYAPQAPPELLYHGTAARFLDSIREQGLLKMGRHHVHLSVETVPTLQVGARRGRPVLPTIRAGDMHRAGHVFCRSANGVWLVDHVPSHFIRFPS